jgi:hypothetical protein
MRTVARFEEVAYLGALVEAGVRVGGPCKVCGGQVTWQPVWLVVAAAVIDDDAEAAAWIVDQVEEMELLGGDESSPIWLCDPCGTGGFLQRRGPGGEVVILRVPGWTMEGRTI